MIKCVAINYEILKVNLSNANVLLDSFDHLSVAASRSWRVSINSIVGDYVSEKETTCINYFAYMTYLLCDVACIKSYPGHSDILGRDILMSDLLHHPGTNIRTRFFL